MYQVVTLFLYVIPVENFANNFRNDDKSLDILIRARENMSGEYFIVIN